MVLDNSNLPSNKLAHCSHCGWSGTISNCTAEEVASPPKSWKSLAGREGTIYKCPKCERMVDSLYRSMS